MKTEVTNLKESEEGHMGGFGKGWEMEGRNFIAIL